MDQLNITTIDVFIIGTINIVLTYRTVLIFKNVRVQVGIKMME